VANALSNPILVELTRGGAVESVHRGSVAVCDAKGRVQFALGDIDVSVFPRSAFKMMQALPLVETGAAERYGVSDEELALACASHSGEAVHVTHVRTWLKRLGLSDRDLACGPHPPVNEDAAKALVRSGEAPTRAHNNCSGKHTGFLTLALHLGAPTRGYEALDHIVQQRVRAAIAEICGIAEADLRAGIDGCAAPNYAMPLKALATGMARIADPASLPEARAAAARRLNAAVKAHPALVAGTGRACSVLIPELRHAATVKTGAEGVFTAVIPGLKLGVALKIDDGATRASETAIASVLVRLGVLDAAAARPFTHAPLLNTRGQEAGERRAAAALA
jgi:L-asparaginase II